MPPQKLLHYSLIERPSTRRGICALENGKGIRWQCPNETYYCNTLKIDVSAIIGLTHLCFRRTKTFFNLLLGYVTKSMICNDLLVGADFII